MSSTASTSRPSASSRMSCRAATSSSGSRPPGPAPTTSSAPSTAARTIRGWAATSSSWSRRPTSSGSPAGRGRRPRARRGAKLFQEGGCGSCHQTEPGGQQGRGPTLYGLFGQQQAINGDGTVTVDESYIRESILNPQAKVAAGFQTPSIMPTFQGQLSEEQILQLIAYIRSLNPSAGGESGTAGTGGGTGAGGTTTTGPTTGGVSPTTQRSNPLAPTSPRQGVPAPQLPPRPGQGTAANAHRRQKRTEKDV